MGNSIIKTVHNVQNANPQELEIIIKVSIRILLLFLFKNCRHFDRGLWKHLKFWLQITQLIKIHWWKFELNWLSLIEVIKNLDDLKTKNFVENSIFFIDLIIWQPWYKSFGLFYAWHFCTGYLWRGSHNSWFDFVWNTAINDYFLSIHEKRAFSSLSMLLTASKKKICEFFNKNHMQMHVCL